MSLEVARPEHTDRAGVEEDGTTAACSAARLRLLRRFRNSNRAEFGDPRRCGRFRVKLLIDVSDHKCAAEQAPEVPSSSPSSAFILLRTQSITQESRSILKIIIAHLGAEPAIENQ